MSSRRHTSKSKSRARDTSNQALSIAELAINAGYQVHHSKDEYRKGAVHYNPVGEGSVIEGVPDNRSCKWEQVHYGSTSAKHTSTLTLVIIAGDECTPSRG